MPSGKKKLSFTKRLVSDFKQFLTVSDQYSIKHKVPIEPLNQKERTQLVGQCEKRMPSIAVSSIIQVWQPYAVVDFSNDKWKTAIALDEESEDDHRVGDDWRLKIF